MSTINLETVPQTWNDETDTAFFTLTARLLSAEFAYGASVLLASFDASTSDFSAASATDEADSSIGAIAASQTDLVPVAARRIR